MAVVSLREVLPRTSEHKFGSTPSSVMKFVCTLDGPTTHTEMHTAIGYTFGSTHPEWPFMVCLAVNVNEPDYFHSEVEFTFGIPETKNQEVEENPLARLDVWSFSSGMSVVPVTYHYDGTGNATFKPASNTAGDPLHGVSTQIGEMKATIKGNRQTFDMAIATQVTGSVNNAAYLGAPPYHWQCQGISANKVAEVVGGATLRYYEVSVALVFRQRGWQARPLNTGLQVLDSSGKKTPATVTLENGKKARASSPVALTATGGQKSDGLPPDALEWRVHPAYDFNTLFGVPT